jgi:hypothetical protein
MILRMLVAFIAACLANLGAILADQVHILAIAHHEINGEAANSCTITVERNTAFHLDRIFTLASLGAPVTGLGTGIASVNTGLIMIVGSHLIFSSAKFGNR